VLEQVFIDEKAEEALRFGLDIKPDQLDVIQHWISLRQRQCKWPAIAPWPGLSKEQLLRGISALSLAAHTDDPLLQLANAHHYNVNAVGRPSRSFADMHARRRLTLSKSRGARLKIGYLSSDLREHAVGFLTPQVYELHDRAKVEVFLYYCNTLPEDAMQRRIRSAGDHWCDIAGMTDEQAAERIVADGIDILVDLNGYTNGARTKMLSMRPAPVIVNWLGYPGTMASPYHDYLVADGFIIPESHEIYYSEKVLRLPCYQPNDRQRVIADSRPTRPDAKLPEDAVVFCCFNGVHKITPFTWRRWMSILRQVPKGVLWLLEGVETTNARLKQLMADHGIAPERLVFAPKMTNANHLARYPLADLFLDTSPYGAHTTSSDALWLGVPVLTLVGRSFASRVCGSLVTAAGLPELVVRDPGAYVAMAVDLGNHPDKLKALRVKLAAQRETCVLFDMKLLVARLEDLYAQMWSDFEAGTIPRPNLANLDIYNEIGIALDDPNIELLAVGDYQDRYRQKLIEFDNFSPLPPDARLWPPSQVRKYR
ncbi:MAG: glycosyl transferase, partial [Rhodospirillaceae bacterium]|nr:glycosyl transferase [Rhodospirillaceae bacterium]